MSTARAGAPDGGSNDKESSERGSSAAAASGHKETAEKEKAPAAVSPPALLTILQEHWITFFEDPSQEMVTRASSRTVSSWPEKGWEVGGRWKDT